MPRVFGLRSRRLAFGSDDVPQARWVLWGVSLALGVFGVPRHLVGRQKGFLEFNAGFFLQSEDFVVGT